MAALSKQVNTEVGKARLLERLEMYEENQVGEPMAKKRTRVNFWMRVSLIERASRACARSLQRKAKLADIAKAGRNHVVENARMPAHGNIKGAAITAVRQHSFEW